MYLWICENTYADVLVTRFPDIKILKHTHNLELVINILFSVTTKQYLWWNSYHKFLSRIASLSSIKCSQYHLGDLYKFCKSHLFFLQLSLLSNKDIWLQRHFQKALQAQGVLLCPSTLFFLPLTPSNHCTWNAMCLISKTIDTVCVFWGERCGKHSEERKKERKETLLKLNKD